MDMSEQAPVSIRTIMVLPVTNGTQVLVDEYTWSDAIRAGGPGIAGSGLSGRLINRDGQTYVVIDGDNRHYFDNANEAITRAFEATGWNLVAVQRFHGTHGKEFQRGVYK